MAVNEPSSTQNYVQIGDKVLNRTADASITTNDVSLSDRVFVFKKNGDGSIKTVVNTPIQYIVDAFSADATAIKNSAKEYCDGIKADTSQLKADTEALKNAAVTAKTNAESARDSAINAKNSASTSATNASNSASSASASATTATTKASEASASASSASKSATSASTSASNASSSASSASASATSASSSASTATAKASDASNSANQAKGYRDEIQQLSEQLNPASILLSVYPVGSIYMSTRPTSPSVLFGGSWVSLDGNSTFWFSDWTSTTTANLEENGKPIKNSPELPNIYGWADIPKSNNERTPKHDGVLSTSSGALGGNNANWGGSCIRLTIDASKNSSYYKSGGDLRPRSYQVYAWWRQS